MTYAKLFSFLPELEARLCAYDNPSLLSLSLQHFVFKKVQEQGLAWPSIPEICPMALTAIF